MNAKDNPRLMFDSRLLDALCVLMTAIERVPGETAYACSRANVVMRRAKKALPCGVPCTYGFSEVRANRLLACFIRALVKAVSRAHSRGYTLPDHGRVMRLAVRTIDEAVSRGDLPYRYASAK